MTGRTDGSREERDSGPLFAHRSTGSADGIVDSPAAMKDRTHLSPAAKRFLDYLPFRQAEEG